MLLLFINTARVFHKFYTEPHTFWILELYLWVRKLIGKPLLRLLLRFYCCSPYLSLATIPASLQSPLQRRAHLSGTSTRRGEPVINPFIDESQDVPWEHTGFPGPFVFEDGNYYYVFGTGRMFFRRRTFSKDDLERFVLDLDFAEESGRVVQIWGNGIPRTCETSHIRITRATTIFLLANASSCENFVWVPHCPSVRFCRLVVH